MRKQVRFVFVQIVCVREQNTPNNIKQIVLQFFLSFILCLSLAHIILHIYDIFRVDGHAI